VKLRVIQLGNHTISAETTHFNRFTVIARTPAPEKEPEAQVEEVEETEEAAGPTWVWFVIGFAVMVTISLLFVWRRRKGLTR
jgi:hypothetical protein